MIDIAEAVAARRTIKAHLGLPMEETLLLCGIGIGDRDPDHPLSRCESDRVPLDE